jgi:uncharacterized protein YkwD
LEYEVKVLNMYRVVGVALGVLVLCACGGGSGSGGGSTPASTPPVQAVPTPIVEISTLIKSVPAPVYANNPAFGVNSQLTTVFNFYNAEMTRCGFGARSQNSVLDKAAQNHTAYQVANNSGGHGELAGTTGFTGATILDQINYAGGYAGGLTQVANQGSMSGIDALKGLFAAPYHMAALTNGYTEMGLGYGVFSVPADPAINFHGFKEAKFVANVGSLGNGKANQQLDPAAVATYPCDDAVTVPPVFFGEDPSPGWSTSGYPIAVKIRDGHILAITSATITSTVAGATTEPVFMFTQANNPNATAEPLPNSIAFVVPKNPLRQSTRYTVHIEGTNNGVAFKAVDFVFKTEAYDFSTTPTPDTTGQ